MVLTIDRELLTPELEDRAVSSRSSTSNTPIEGTWKRWLDFVGDKLKKTILRVKDPMNNIPFNQDDPIDVYVPSYNSECVYTDMDLT